VGFEFTPNNPPVGSNSFEHSISRGSGFIRTWGRPWYAVAASGLALLALGPLWVAWIDARPHTENFRIPEPAAAGGWTATEVLHRLEAPLRQPGGRAPIELFRW